MSHECIISAVALIVALVSCAGADFEVGRTPFSFQVDRQGAATCELPLFSSPAAGVFPSLSRKFNSKWTGDVVGSQFALGELTAIHRGPKEYQLDGVVHGVDYTDDDRLTLDTMRLVLVNGSYWYDGAEFRSEIDSFSRILRTGEGFIMRTKARQVMEYGLTPDSRVMAQGKTVVNLWALNKVKDWAGNYFTLSYAQTPESGDYRLSHVNYTGNVRAKLSPYNSTEFSYETRPDVRSLYLAGSLMQTSFRLKTIRTITEGVAMKEYRLSYQQDCLTNRSQLTNLQECDGNNKCFPPTYFNWSTVCPQEAVYQKADGILSKINPDGASSLSVMSLNLARFTLSDINNDGVTDIYEVTGYGQTSNDKLWIRKGDQWHVVQGPPSKIRGSVAAANVDLHRIRLHDMDGDGHADVHYIPSDGIPAPDIFYILHENGSYDTYTGLSHTIPSSLDLGALALQRIMYGDFDGDGKVDIFEVPDYGLSPPANSLIYLNLDGHRWSEAIPGPAFSIRGYVAGAKLDLQRVRVVDWNGDGLSDLYWQQFSEDAPTPDLVYINSGNVTRGYFSSPPIAGPPTQLRKAFVEAGADVARLRMGDFNCDGQLDAYVITLGNQADEVWINKGDGTYRKVDGPQTDVSPIPEATSVDSRRISLIDWTGNSCTDVHYVRSRNGVSMRDWVFVSSGNPDRLFSTVVEAEESNKGEPDSFLGPLGESKGAIGLSIQHRAVFTVTVNYMNMTSYNTIFVLGEK